MNRRVFMQSTTAAAALGPAATPGAHAQSEGKLPAVISSANGIRATEKAMEMIRAGADTLDAVVAGVSIVEEDPNEATVGYGGLPNEDGVVQLDASVMHGPTCGAGSVAALENIVHAARVAQKVMECTDHVLLVGEGALRFAKAMGFEETNLLTPEARERWLQWKRDANRDDDWIDPKDRLPGSPTARRALYHGDILRHHGTINCNAVNEKGEISGVTTTSGLSYKIPGRVGDSPIIGAGLYVDNEVGAAGSTGRGEANLKTCASFLAVEFMRQGLSPEEAGLRVLERIVDNTVEPYLLDDQGRPNFGLNFYCINKKGQFAGVTLYSGAKYAAHDGEENKLRESAYLFKKEEG